MKYYLKSIKSYWPLACKISDSPTYTFFLLLSIPVRWRLFGRIPRRIQIRGFDFFVRDGADISALREVFLERQYEVSSHPKKIADIGGHIGSASLFFHLEHPEAEIYLYEPDPDNFKMSKLNLSKIENIKIFNKAVSSSDDMVDMYLDSGSSTKSSIKSGNGQKISVPAVSMSSVVRLCFDVIKFDIEGEEYDAFRSVSYQDKEKTLFYIGEFHYRLTGKSRENFEQLFPGFMFDWGEDSMSCSVVRIYKKS